MNIVILKGKIVGKYNYRFIFNNKSIKNNGYNFYKNNIKRYKNLIAIIYFELVLENGSIVNLYAYNEIADETYRKLYKLKNKNLGNYEVFIYGRLDSKMNVKFNEVIFL